jgi:seryl-tRNA synthetase
MLDVALIRAEPARVRAALARRGVPPEAVDAVVELDAQAAGRIEVREALRIRRRRISEEIAKGKGSAPFSAPARDDLMELGREVAAELAAVEADLADLEARRLQAIYALPNLPATDTPEACTEVNNTRGLTPAARITTVSSLHHADLIELLGLAVAAEAPGPGRGFLIWRGQGARLVRALTAFMLDIHTREFGCEEIRAPAITTRAALTNSAHLPLLEGKMYAVATDAELFLAPRAEPALANLYADKTLDAARLPIRLVSAGPAFRREASAGGAAGRGLIRLHEFDTVELYAFARPDQDDEELARAVRAAETILTRLEVPFRRRLRAARDLSHAAAKTIDFEVWAPGCNLWLPVAAISSFTDYQSRRTATRYRDVAGRTRFVYTLGGAAVALPHLVAALLENGQEADGSVRLAPALAPYFGGDTLRV